MEPSRDNTVRTERRVSCIICAYNEADRIGHVLDAVNKHPRIDEVIVVDDGSTDQTREVIARYPGVHCLPLARNGGKSAALVAGVRASKGDLLLFLDADLMGLSADDVTALIEPVARNDADMSISLRKNSHFMCRIIGFDYLSGERVLPKQVIEGHLDTIAALPRFGVEAYMNELVVHAGLRIAVVDLKRVTNPGKQEKLGWVAGNLAQLKMMGDILKVISVSEGIKQNYLIAQHIQGQKHDIAEKIRGYAKRITNAV